MIGCRLGWQYFFSRRSVDGTNFLLRAQVDFNSPSGVGGALPYFYRLLLSAAAAAGSSEKKHGSVLTSSQRREGWREENELDRKESLGRKEGKMCVCGRSSL